MVPALLMFATASLGFGGHPWIACLAGTILLVADNIPERALHLWAHRHQPNADILLSTLWAITTIIVAAAGTAWAGYGARLLVLLRVQ
jgi:hypothetical protein